MVQRKYVACNSKLNEHWPAVARMMNQWTNTLKTFSEKKVGKTAGVCRNHFRNTDFSNWFLHQAQQNRAVKSILVFSTTSKFYLLILKKKKQYFAYMSISRNGQKGDFLCIDRISDLFERVGRHYEL